MYAALQHAKGAVSIPFAFRLAQIGQSADLTPYFRSENPIPVQMSLSIARPRWTLEPINGAKLVFLDLDAATILLMIMKESQSAT